MYTSAKYLTLTTALLLLFFSCETVTDTSDTQAHYSISIMNLNTNEKLSDVNVTLTEGDLDKKHKISNSSGHVEFTTSSMSNMLSFEKDGYVYRDTLDVISGTNDSVSQTYFRSMTIYLQAIGDTTGTEGKVHYSITIKDLNTNKSLSDVQVALTSPDIEKTHYLTDSTGHVEFTIESNNNMLSFEKHGYMRLDTLDVISINKDSTSQTQFRILNIRMLADNDTIPDAKLEEIISQYQDSINVLITRIDSLGQFVNDSLNFKDSIQSHQIHRLDSLVHLLDSLNNIP